MKPPKRQRTSTKLYEPTSHNVVRWTLEEKRKLLLALKVTEEEVHSYINVVRNKAKRKASFLKDTDRIHAPIEVWLKNAEDLTHYSRDSSYVIGQAMSLAGNLEPRLEPKTNIEPDYRAIYAYISALLMDEMHLPELRPIDAAVVLDMLEGIAADMKSCDLSQQRELMLKKHNVINTKVEPKNFIATYGLYKSTLQEDPLDQPSTSNASQENRTQESTGSTNTSQEQTNSNNTSEHPILTNTSQENGPSTSSMNTSQFIEDNNQSQETNVNISDKDSTPADDKKHAKYTINLPKKSVMHSLNPFNVPVKYLRPRRKTST